MFEKAIIECRKGTKIKALIVPGTKKFSLKEFDTWRNSLKIRVDCIASKGKANKRICSKLSKIFSAKTEIIKGKNSREKTLLVYKKRPFIKKRLEELFKA